MALTGEKESSNPIAAAGRPRNPEVEPVSSSWFPLAPLVVLFAAGGCAALIYEIIWFQMLQLVLGSTAISLGVILGSFMGGMSLGSVVVPRFLPSWAQPLRLWALLEMGIGALGIAVLFGLPWLAKGYAALVPSGFVGILFRGLLCGVCLLPPTILMGGTLPVISRLAQPSREGAAQLSLVYGANTVGAMFGALLTGFFVLRLFDVFTATYIAAGINGTIAMMAVTIRTPVSNPTPASENVNALGQSFKKHWPLFITIAASGFCALGAEVVWTRLLSLILGGTTYTFSIILAVFLFGIGIGSGVGAMALRRTSNPGFTLGTCQFLLAGAIAWTAFMLAKSLPYWPIDQTLSKNVWFNFQLDLLRCVWAVLPATLLWGASFPLALAALAQPGKDAGQLVASLYAANTLGAIIGAVGSSVFLIAWLGTQQTQRLLIIMSAAAGLLMLFASNSPAQMETVGDKDKEVKKLSAKSWGVASLATALTLFLAWNVPPVPWPLIAYGRYLPGKRELGTVLYSGEGMNASVAVTELSTGVRNFHVSGKIEASSDQQDMRLQRMLGHIPALFHPDPHSVLVVGCGAGVTAGSFLVHPSIRQVNLCEIEPLIPKIVAHYFGQENYDVVQDPRVRLIYDDARHYILTTHEKFDVITSDPIHPWVKGAATLYTKEYFELCKNHLNAGAKLPLSSKCFPAARSGAMKTWARAMTWSFWDKSTLSKWTSKRCSGA
jgi:spermidine synthase